MHPIIKFHKYHAALIESYIKYLALKDKSVCLSFSKMNTIYSSQSHISRVLVALNHFQV